MKKIIFVIMCAASLLQSYAATFTGKQNRLVVFARFNGDPEMDVSRTKFEAMFNGDFNSFKSYFKSVSNEKLDIDTKMFPNNVAENSSYELKYCYYCYDSAWKGSYPNCKGSDITSSFDINMGFIIQELAGYMEESESTLTGEQLDSDNDGVVDNFVIVFRGAGRGQGKGIYTPQIGSVSSLFTNVHGDIKIKGKAIKNYTITYERNSLETHCRFMLNQMGFPYQYRSMRTYPRVVGTWDPMDGPTLSLPLTYNRMKYSQAQWIEDIPAISAPGTYYLSPSGESQNYAYKLMSSDPNQFWVIEYRDKNGEWEENIPESGLIIYRVNTKYNGTIASNSEIYIYRKDGTPTEPGNVFDASFSNFNQRTSFNATSNPSSFMYDGSISDDISITNIVMREDKLYFDVEKVFSGVETTLDDEWTIIVDSNLRVAQLSGEGIEDFYLYDLSGRLLKQKNNLTDNIVNLNEINSGIYVAKISGKKTKTQMIKIL